MNRMMFSSVLALAWLFVISAMVSAILWLGLRLARARNRAEARTRRILDLEPAAAGHLSEDRDAHFSC
jgi:hypothetical protein